MVIWKDNGDPEHKRSWRRIWVFLIIGLACFGLLIAGSFRYLNDQNVQDHRNANVRAVAICKAVNEQRTGIIAAVRQIESAPSSGAFQIPLEFAGDNAELRHFVELINQALSENAQRSEDDVSVADTLEASVEKCDVSRFNQSAS